MADARLMDDLRYLIRCAVDRRKPDLERVQTMDLEKLYQLSRFHSLAALTYTAVEAAWDGHPPADCLPAGWKGARDTAIRNTLLFTAERKALEAFCEEKGIWYLPLKGILLQKDYPGLGLREMSDNDILFDENFQQQIHDWFVARGYHAEEYRQSNHDSYHKAPILNFEMHTSLFVAAKYPEWSAYFDRAVAIRLQTPEGVRWGRCFTLEDFYLYTLAHMYKHFETSGTGIRSLLDLFLFHRAHDAQMDHSVLQQGLEQLGLTEFDRQTCALAEQVFGSDAPLSPADTQKLAYYLTSGTYGTVGHHTQNELVKMAGNERAIKGMTKLRYSLRRLFPDRTFMEMWCHHDAPFFLQHLWLMPLAYGYRLVYNLAHGKGKYFIGEQRYLWKTHRPSPKN